MKFASLNHPVKKLFTLIVGLTLSAYAFNLNAQSNIYPAESDVQITKGKLFIQTDEYRPSLLTFKDIHYSPYQEFNFGLQGNGLVLMENNTIRYHFKSGGGFVVGGKIEAREVLIHLLAGADFVFNDDYKLPPLSEVERYVKANRHLPGVASENDMRANGIELGKMNITLLQKVEEITLYMIDLQKQVDMLKKENSRLESEVSELKKN